MSNAGTALHATLSPEQLRHLVTLDPSSPIDRGRLTALRRQTTQLRQLAIIDRMLATPTQPQAGRVERWWQQPPAGNAGPKALTASDVAWLQRLPTDPAQLSREDVTALARLSAQVADGSPVPGPDARLIRAYYEPVVAHLERQARIEELNAVVGPRTQPTAPPAPPWTPQPGDPLLEEITDAEEAHARAQLDAARSTGQPVDGIVVDRRAIAMRITEELKAVTDAQATARQERRTAALAELKALEAS